MAELVVIRLDSVTGEWEHNHAEGNTGTKEEGKRWLADLHAGKVPKGKFCEWDEITETTDDWVEVSNFRFGPYGGPDAGKLVHSLQKARIKVIF